MSPNVLHWANNAHHRHTAGFYYGVPWRAATCNNVFFTGEARLAQIDITYRILSHRSTHKILNTIS